MKVLRYIKHVSVAVISIMAGLTASAEDYIAISKNGNVYDEPNAKYVTLNSNNDNVAVLPGMVFAVSEHTPGWYKVEYSPGLHAFIPEGIAATSFNSVTPGTYDIKNNPGQKIAAQGSGNDWTATVDGKTYKGKQTQDLVVFYDNANNIIFSLVDVGNGPIAISYDNSVTKFF